MSIESLAFGDVVVKQAGTATSGASFGNAFSYVDGASLDCLIQTVSTGESQKYAARGMEFTHQVFFSADPGLSSSDQLKWTTKDGAALGTAKILRILDCYREGRPGEALLWIADVSEVQTRMET